ncbi:MAG: signal peptide peptidase SppA [Methanosarcina sp.]
MSGKNLDPEDKNPDDISGTDAGKNSLKSENEGVSSKKDSNYTGKDSISETFSSNNTFPDTHSLNASFSNEPPGSASSENTNFNKNSSFNPPNEIQSTPSTPSTSATSSIPSPPSTPLQDSLRNENGAGNLNLNSNPFPQKKKRNLLSSILIVIGLFTIILVSIAGISYVFGLGGDSEGSGKVAVIYVQGTILSGSVPSGLGYATSEEISENIRNSIADEGVKAIVLRVNSPGGSPAAAQEIVREIKRAREKNISVVVSMGDLAASAAYYIAAPTDYIIANPSTSTGSIGVIWTFQDLTVSNKREGIDYYISKSGDFKDMGSPWRGLTDEEKEYADSVVMESYEDFITEVAEGRNLSKSEVRALADGRIYTGAKAKELGLIDGYGNLYDAIDKAAELGGIVGEPRVVYVNRVSLSRLLLGSDAGEPNKTINQVVSYFEESPYGKISA